MRGVPCSDSNVASIAFEHGATAIGNTLIDIRNAASRGDASACADISLLPEIVLGRPGTKHLNPAVMCARSVRCHKGA